MEDDPGPDDAAALGWPHAPRRGRFAGLRLHRPDGHPLADPHPWSQCVRPGPGRLGPDTAGIPTSARTTALCPPATANRAICPPAISMPIGPAPSSVRRPVTQIAAIFVRLDGHLPRPADWVTGPGSIRPDVAAWQAVQRTIRLCRRVGRTATANRGGGQPGAFRLLAQQLPLPAFHRRGPLRMGPFRRGDGQSPRGKESGIAKAAGPRTGPARPQRACGGVRRVAQASLGHGEQSRRVGQRLQLAAADRAGPA